MYLIEIAVAIFLFSTGALSVWVTAYSKEKGKNKALQEDLTQLENEKQKIQAKYQTEIEELKKAHTLDIKKREFKYIDKREQFTKYFALLEEFHGKSNDAMVNGFKPIMAEFLMACVNENADQEKALQNFSNSVHDTITELNRDVLKLKSETHGIRLISSDVLDSLLNELEACVSESTSIATDMVSVIGSKEFWIDQTILKPYEIKNIEAAKKVEVIHSKVKQQMKTELDEI